MRCRSSSVILVLGLIGSIEASAGASQARSSTTDPWRSSWPQFVAAVEAWRSAGNPVAKASFDGLIKGDPAPADLPVMKRFGGTVTFEGTFKGVGTDSLMSGMTAKILLDLPDARGSASDHKYSGIAHVYPAAAAVGAWKAATVGSVVKFRAVVKAVDAMEPLPGNVAYIVLLQDAEIVSK